MALLSGTLQCPPAPNSDATSKIGSAVALSPAPALEIVPVQPPVVPPTNDGVAGSDPTGYSDMNMSPPTTTITPAGATAAAGAITEPTQLPGALPQTEPVAQTVSDPRTIIVTANQGAPRGDPIAVVNELSFGAVQVVDEAVVAPVARGYQDGVPAPIRAGVHNLLNHLDEPVVFVNFLLQFKIGKALETVGRFAINSTIGVAGLFDVAKKAPFYLPRRPNGLADTLGFYGVGPGPYLFLPLVGSTTVRDLLGRLIDLSLLPTAVGKPFTNPIVSASKSVLSSIDDRIKNDAIFTRVQQSGNPYAAMREYYLKKRQAEIDVLRGKRCNADLNLTELEFLDSLPASDDPVKQPTAPQNK